MNFSNFIIDKLTETEQTLAIGSKKASSNAFLFSDIIKVCEQENAPLSSGELESNKTDATLEIYASSENVVKVSLEEFETIAQYITSLISQNAEINVSGTTHKVDNAAIEKLQFVLPEDKLIELTGKFIDKSSFSLIPLTSATDLTELTKPLNISYKNGSSKLSITISPIKVDESSTSNIINNEFSFVNKLMVSEGLMQNSPIISAIQNTNAEESESGELTCSDENLEYISADDKSTEPTVKLFYKAEIIKIEAPQTVIEPNLQLISLGINSSIDSPNVPMGPQNQDSSVSVDGIHAFKFLTNNSDFDLLKNLQQKSEVKSPTVVTELKKSLKDNVNEENIVDLLTVKNPTAKLTGNVEKNTLFEIPTIESSKPYTNTVSANTGKVPNEQNFVITADKSVQNQKPSSAALNYLMDGLTDEEKSIFKGFASRGEISEIKFAKQSLSAPEVASSSVALESEIKTNAKPTLNADAQNLISPKAISENQEATIGSVETKAVPSEAKNTNPNQKNTELKVSISNVKSEPLVVEKVTSPIMNNEVELPNESQTNTKQLNNNAAAKAEVKVEVQSQETKVNIAGGFVEVETPSGDVNNTAKIKAEKPNLSDAEKLFTSNAKTPEIENKETQQNEKPAVESKSLKSEPEIVDIKEMNASSNKKVVGIEEKPVAESSSLKYEPVVADKKEVKASSNKTEAGSELKSVRESGAVDKEAIEKAVAKKNYSRPKLISKEEFLATKANKIVPAEEEIKTSEVESKTTASSKKLKVSVETQINENNLEVSAEGKLFVKVASKASVRADKSLAESNESTSRPSRNVGEETNTTELKVNADVAEKHVVESAKPNTKKIDKSEQFVVTATVENTSAKGKTAETKTDVEIKNVSGNGAKKVNPSTAEQQLNQNTDNENAKSNSSETFKNNLNQVSGSEKSFSNENLKLHSDSKPVHEQFKTVKQQEIMPEFSKLIQQGEKQTLTLQLTPENLGKVKLTVDMIENQIITKIEVENEQVKQFVQSNIEQLKQNMQSAGIPLTNVNVSLSEDKNNSKMFTQKKKSSSREEKEDVIEETTLLQAKRHMGYNTYEFTA